MPAGFPLQEGFHVYGVSDSSVRELVVDIQDGTKNALSSIPPINLAWASRGTKVFPGYGITKIPITLPGDAEFRPYTPGTPREYTTLHVTTHEVSPSPYTNNTFWPFMWGPDGRVVLKTPLGKSFAEFMGVGDLPAQTVEGGRVLKTNLVSSLFWTSMTSTAMGLSATRFTYKQPGAPNGLPLFTNGVDTSAHYAHPMRVENGTFKTLFEIYGKYSDKFEDSLLVIPDRPHPLYPRKKLGVQTTDIIGPTWMRKKFWKKAQQTFQFQSVNMAGALAAAAPSNVFSAEALSRYMSEAMFIGAAGFGPVTYWINSDLDTHPYYTANSGAHMTDGDDGGPSDMWITVASTSDSQHYAVLAAPNADFVPNQVIRGENDPIARSQMTILYESDLYADCAPGKPHFIAMFVEK